jgi:hypothetical protein
MNYFFITIGVLFLIYILVSIKKNEFTMEESAFWILGAIVALLLSIFYKGLDKLGSILGIAYGPSFVFLLAILFLLFMNFRNSKKILKMNEKINKLSHKVSILEYELKERTKENVKEEKETNRKKESK